MNIHEKIYRNLSAMSVLQFKEVLYLRGGMSAI